MVTEYQQPLRWQPMGRHDPLNIRCYTWATVGTIATIAAAATSMASIGYSAAQGAPKTPDLASASREVAQAQANALPVQRGLAAAEQQGGQFSQFVPTHTEQQTFVKVPTGFGGGTVGPGMGGGGTLSQVADAANGMGLADVLGGVFGFGNDKPQYKYIPYKAEDWKEGGKYADYLTQHPKFDLNSAITQKSVKVKAGEQLSDFTGVGTADIEGKLAQQYADIQTKLGAKYGKAFAENATAEARQADPLGFAARDKQLSMIQDQIAHPLPISPLSGEINDQVQAQVDAGKGLDPMSREMLDAAIARSAKDRGQGGDAAGVETAATTGAAGQARLQAAEGKGVNWLSSGATPQDIAYRQEQQNLADLGSFVGGQTPQSQFNNLSGAQQGATPFVPGQQQPTMPNNAGPAGSNFSVGAWQQNLRNQSSQANGWMGGISALLSGVGAAAKTGQ